MLTCSATARGLLNSFAGRTWSTLCAGWMGQSSVRIKARPHTSEFMKRGALRAGVAHAPVPDPGGAIHLPTRTEALLPRAISQHHAILCLAIAHPPGDLRSTIVHHLATIARAACHSYISRGDVLFKKIFFFLLFFNPRLPHWTRLLSFIACNLHSMESPNSPPASSALTLFLTVTSLWNFKKLY